MKNLLKVFSEIGYKFSIKQRSYFSCTAEIFLKQKDGFIKLLLLKTYEGSHGYLKYAYS